MSMKRTQLYLPEELRTEVDKHRKQTGESLAQYFRDAVEHKLSRSKKLKVDLKKLADEFIGCSKKSDKEIQEWVDWVSEERKRADRKMEEI